MLKKKQQAAIWQEFCGFLDLPLEQYMEIQKRLLLEQLFLYRDCELSERILRGHQPQSVEEYRRVVPLTTYHDYADMLIPKREDTLPAKPVIWIETTWEGAQNPIKRAPYTQSMIDHHANTYLSAMILATSNKKGEFSLMSEDTFLFGFAPLPFFTGIAPLAIERVMNIRFLPPMRDAVKMNFSQRTQSGFAAGLRHGVDLFSGMSSVIARMSESFLLKPRSGGPTKRRRLLLQARPSVLLRLLRALRRHKKTGQPPRPRDIWTLKGLIIGGTDTVCYRRKIEEAWGVKPLEIFGGTEPTCIGVETWTKKSGMCLFPNVCFYEFIPENEMEKNLADPSYQPKTFLMDELVAGERYELVISNFKGGAFMRYRAGDVFECVSLKNEEEDIAYPQFRYIDRIPTIIDIAGFTRISENTVKEAIGLSRLQVSDWFALKQFDEHNRAFMHLYVEMAPEALVSGVVASQIIAEHLSIYFRHIDSDYTDLKHLLGIEPLIVSVLPTGTIRNFSQKNGVQIRRINPSHYLVCELLKYSRENGVSWP
jgi:hypothetical protein